MKALTLWQPWASAIPLGLKSIETRSWSTRYRGLLAIHASSRVSHLPRRARTLFGNFKVERDGSGLLLRGGRLAWPYRMPLGAVVAIVSLQDCVPVEAVRNTISEVEHAFGDYSDRRYAWLFRNVLPIPDPIECNGRQGLWTLPQEVLTRVEALV